MAVVTEVAVDLKRAAQKFHTATGRKTTHYYTSLGEVANGIGRCMQCGTDCRVPVRPDLTTAGLSCQPFSGLRDLRVQSPRQHPLFGNTFEEFPKYLANIKPRGWIVEQVKGFGREDAEHPERLSFLVQFCELVASIGYSVKVLELDSGIWSESERDRCPPILRA
jgi:site-specific DNA-cytosine methylase